MQRRRRWFVGVLSTLLVLLVLAGTGWGMLRWANARCWQAGPPLVCRADAAASGARVALTFDDGPTAEGVDAVLPALQRAGVHATFFVIGEQVQAHPEQARRLVEAGHELGGHSWSHQRMWFSSATFYDTEISRTDAALVGVGGTPRWFRPPFGKKLVGLPRAVERAGLTTVMWSVEDDLTGTLTPEQYAARIVDAAGPGDILLMHVMDADATGREALPLVLSGLADKGLQVGTVGQLLGQSPADGG